MYRFKKERQDAQVAINGSRLVINQGNVSDPAVQKTIADLMKFHPQLAENFEDGDPGEPYPDQVEDPLDKPQLGSGAAPAGVPAESVADALADLPADQRDPAAEAAVENADVAASPSTKRQSGKGNK